jgi:putative transposase
MPRNSRNLPAGSVVHVVNRGNDKKSLFESARNYEEFLRLIAWAKGICPVRVVAYCVMSNHWHFVFWVEVEWDVSAFLHRLTTTHAARVRHATDTIGHGHVYQDRFKGSKIFSERYYFNCLRYVERNPAAAGLVHSASNWRWSSLAERLGNGRGILDPDPLGLPLGWAELVDKPLPARDADEIRRALKRY